MQVPWLNPNNIHSTKCSSFKIHSLISFCVCLCVCLSVWSGKSIDPQTLFHNASCDIICSILFGSRYEYEHEFFQTMIKMMSENSKIANGPWGMVYICCFCMLQKEVYNLTIYSTLIHTIISYKKNYKEF